MMPSEPLGGCVRPSINAGRSAPAPDNHDMRPNTEAHDTDVRIGVVIPSYKVRKHILGVIAAMGEEVDRIYVVDDACPEHSGRFTSNCIAATPRVRILRHAENRGVGGAVLTGYAAAIEDGVDVIVKVDGDGQMDPRLIPAFVAPIAAGEADYTKGNRFFDLEKVRVMPKMRLFGNAALSFLTKLSSGYWDLFDPTNGYTAIHVAVARHLPLKKSAIDISSRRMFYSG